MTEEHRDIEGFSKEREEGNEVVMKYAGLEIKRYFSLDSQAYRAGSLTAKTKELIGLIASFVLRCDDCVKYHLIRCKEEGLDDEELVEALTIGLVVGGTITVPQLRGALKTWDKLKTEKK